jgi:hypothetical protein
LRFDEASKLFSAGLDFTAGSRFDGAGTAGNHPVHDP